ncbi:hypothetical protein [Mariniluteicoccus flavus]
MQRWKLVAAVAAVAAVVIASVIVLLVTSTREAVTPPPPPVESQGPRIDRPTQPPSPSVTPHIEDRPSNPDQANQIKVGNAYMDAFLQPGSIEERAARLKEWGTPQNVEQAKLTNRLPNARRKGDVALDPTNARPNQTQAHVQLTDGSWWAMTLVKDPTVAAQWRVHVATREGH